MVTAVWPKIHIPQTPKELIMTKTWAEADTLLRHKTSRNPVASRKVAPNTYVQRRGADIAVRLHATDIVIFHSPLGDLAGRVSIFTGGWNTITTRDRINRFTPNALSVFTEKRVAYVRMGSWANGLTVTLSEGFSAREDGTDPRHGAELTPQAPARSSSRSTWAGNNRPAVSYAYAPIDHYQPDPEPVMITDDGYPQFDLEWGTDLSRHCSSSAQLIMPEPAPLWIKK